MRFSPIVLVASLAGLSSAAGLADALPKCALPCLMDVAKDNVIPCEASDLKCICEEKNYKTLYAKSSACILESCGNKVAIDEVLPAAQKLCDSVKEGSSSSSSSFSSAKETKSAKEESESTTSQKPTSSSAEKTSHKASETATETSTSSSATQSATETPGMAAHATGFVAAPLVAMAMAALL